MLSILLDVYQIIHDVDTTGDQTKTKGDKGGLEKGIWLKELAIKDKSDVNNNVFGPLVWTHGPKQTAYIGNKRAWHCI